MSKFTACLNNSVRGNRERERAVSACGLEMEQKSHPECTKKTEKKMKLNKTPQVGPCDKQGFEGVTHQ